MLLIVFVSPRFFFFSAHLRRVKKKRPPPSTHTHTVWPFFSPLCLSLSSFLLSSPHLRAEEPQCLLLTFSYHLSPFHHHHHHHTPSSPPTAELSVISPGSPSPLLAHHLCPAVSSVFSLSGGEQVKFSSPPSRPSASPLSYPDSSFHYGGMIPVTPVRAVI